MSDYLDDLIESNRMSDPGFAKKWEAAELRIALITLRQRAKLTQEEVAVRMGVARPRVAELESRPLNVSFGRMLAYANALGVSIDEIAHQVSSAA